jgi:hypothetical protein
MSIKTILKNLIDRSEFAPRANHAGRLQPVLQRQDAITTVTIATS